MTQFIFDIQNSAQQYIQITAVFNTPENITRVQLPAWRPGRYELGNFAKNVKGFKVYSADNNSLSAHKISKDCWEVNTSDTDQISVQYSYYAAELNAGSSFLSADQLYVNPVNCCVYTDESFNDAIEVKLNVPDYWDVATGMNCEGKLLSASDFDELFDSPFIASPDLQHEEYMSGDVKFHVWFNGEVKPDWKRVLKDFKAFTDKQLEKFIEFPAKEYHFLNQILPNKAYHGVEHTTSTVITLGPTYDVFGDLYKELLGVSSHELYHSWNVKTIRPIEMYPYDFTKENYSKLGYICEGVTTYMGDLFLLKSGVFNDEQYFNELKRQLQRHFDNHARFNVSVAESSYDTWLDGYVPGVPGRKVSIYTEGCLISFVLDVRIRRATGNKYGLDEVMKRLYFNFALNNKGVSEVDYKKTIEEVSGESMDDFFACYVNGHDPFESIITDAFEYLGLELIHNPSESYAEGRLGFKTMKSGKNFIVKSVYPGGPAEVGGLMYEDEVVAVNDFACEGELDKWLNYFDDDTKVLTVLRAGRTYEVVLPEVNRNFYLTYNVKKLKEPNSHQKKAFEAWKK